MTDCHVTLAEFGQFCRWRDLEWTQGGETRGVGALLQEIAVQPCRCREL
jgi:hypothetical protein